VLASILWREAQGPFGAAMLGASMVGGPDGHHRLVMETTLVVWQSFGVSGVHGGGREGMESIVWLSVAESLDNNFYCSH
jgi:hypothetical protein